MEQDYQKTGLSSMTSYFLLASSAFFVSFACFADPEGKMCGRYWSPGPVFRLKIEK